MSSPFGSIAKLLGSIEGFCLAPAARSMIRLAVILALALPSALWVNLCQAQEEEKEEHYTIEALNDNGWWEVDLNTGTAIGTNGVIFSFSGAFVTADSILFNEKS